MRTSCLLLLVAVGCGVEAPGVTFLAPAPGSQYTRETLVHDTGELVASVPLELDITGDVARVTITAGQRELGDAISGALTAHLPASGPVTLTATALDETGTPLATATLDISVVEPAVADCKGWLDLYQLDYTSGPERQGVADPVTVKPPINGIAYRYNGSATPRETLFGDCKLMKSLAEGAAIMRQRGIVQLVDIGVYNYRCIDQSKTPPNCNMSQHAFATAIDIAGFEASDGTKYSVLDDWVINTGPTCTSETKPGKDTFLHEVICALKEAGVWNIVLTPNYNSAHRNHFHVDLTEGSDFIERLAPGGLVSLGEYRELTAVYGD